MCRSIKIGPERRTVSCPQCGSANRDDASFCTQCGTALPTSLQAVPRAHALRLADYGRRAGAFAIDLIAVIAIFLVVLVVAVVILAVAISPGDEGEAWGVAILGVLLGALCGVVVAVVMFAFFWARSQSPGKAALDLQVVDRDGKPTNFGRMLVREMLLKGVVVSPPIGFAGYLWPPIRVCRVPLAPDLVWVVPLAPLGQTAARPPRYHPRHARGQAGLA